MTATALPFDPAKLPAALRQGQPLVDDLRNVSRQTREMLAEADGFDEGQIAGPYGPQFVGFGEMPPPTWREELTSFAWLFGKVSAASLLALFLLGAFR